MRVTGYHLRDYAVQLNLQSRFKLSPYLNMWPAALPGSHSLLSPAFLQLCVRGSTSPIMMFTCW